MEGHRDPKTGRVKQQVVRHIGYAETGEDISRLKTLGQHLKAELLEARQPCLFSPQTLAEMALETQENLPENPKDYAVDDVRKLRTKDQHMTGIHTVFGKPFDRIFEGILNPPSQKKYAKNVLRDLVMARIARPDSKRGSVRFLEQNCGIKLNLDGVYRAMDELDDTVIARLQDRAFEASKQLFHEKLDVVFYDATTLYFESFTEDDLRAKGFSKDHKSQEVQVLLSIFVTHAGIPLGYELFPGSTYEGHTLVKALETLKTRFEVGRVVFVADSGMLNQQNLELLEAHGYVYLVGARLKNMAAPITQAILSEAGYESLNGDTQDQVSAKVIALDQGRKLVISHSTKRARKDAHDREVAFEKLRKKLKKGASASAGAGQKYLKLTGSSNAEIDPDKVEKAARWDGFCGIMTNMEQVDAAEVIQHYRGLWQVEETFRVTKHDLRIRPIYHWTQKRVKAHIALCFMALVCVRHVEYRMRLFNKPMSPERIRQACLTVGITTLEHVEDHRVFAVPTKPSEDAKAIFKANDLPLSTTPYLCC